MTLPNNGHDDACPGLDFSQLHCIHCGQRVTLNLPLPIIIVRDLMYSFSSLHKFCHERTVFVSEKQP